jgi:hypothetical protein
MVDPDDSFREVTVRRGQERSAAHSATAAKDLAYNPAVLFGTADGLQRMVENAEKLFDIERFGQVISRAT